MSNPLETRFVVCAAIRHKHTKNIICGARHFDSIMRNLIAIDGGHYHWQNETEQGFIDQFGNFLSRQEAREIAEKVGQIKKRVGGDREKLFSENLY